MKTISRATINQMTDLRLVMEDLWKIYKPIADRAQTLDQAIAEPQSTEAKQAHDRYMAARAIYLDMPCICPDDYKCCACRKPSLDLAPIPDDIAEVVEALEGWGNLEEGEAGGYCPECLAEWKYRLADEDYDEADEILEYRTRR